MLTLQIHSPVFDPEGNVFVPGYKEVKRKIRKDGKFIRPTDGFTVSARPAQRVHGTGAPLPSHFCPATLHTFTQKLQDLWTPSWESKLPWTQEEARDSATGEQIAEDQLWAKYGREFEWQDGVESVVVRPPLMEVFKDRTSVEAVLFIHRWVTLLLLRR